MAGQGPAPKGALLTQADQARRDSITKRVKADGITRGPDLPERPGEWNADQAEWELAPWPAQTVAWWETWRTSAQASSFTATDWDFLLDTALLHARMWSGDEKVAAELRLRVAKFGATPEDRLRLRLQVEPPGGTSDSPAPAPAPAAPARRDRILKAVGDGS